MGFFKASPRLTSRHYFKNPLSNFFSINMRIYLQNLSYLALKLREVFEVMDIRTICCSLIWLPFMLACGG